MLPLIDKELEEQLPTLYETDGQKNKILFARYHLYGWNWYPMEYSPLQKLFFGLVDGFEKELGYFTLDELEQIGARRDYEFEPKLLKKEDYGKRIA